MKTSLRLILAAFWLATFSLSTATVQAQDYTYTTNNSTITITGYTGSGGAVTIPDTINSYPVTSIGYRYLLHGFCSGAFQECSNVTSVTINRNITNIDDWAFYRCMSLTAISVDPDNFAYSSIDGVLFNKSQTTLIECPSSRAGSYTIPNGVTNIRSTAFSGCTSITSVIVPNGVISIGAGAFSDCASLTSITIPNTLTTIYEAAFENCASLASIVIPASVDTIWGGLECDIGAFPFPCGGAFQGCTNLRGVYFSGNAPALASDFPVVFRDSTNATVYYLPDTAGWGPVFGERLTALWLPQVQSNDATLGVRTNQFGFNIIWASGLTVEVEASTTLTNPTWLPVSTNILTDGWSYFSDPDWVNYPSRFYRVRSQ